MECETPTYILYYMSRDRFSFWCPLEITKGQEKLVDPTTGEEIMRLGGIASTSDKDADGEFLDPQGFDIKPLLESGMVNWHHQAKGQKLSAPFSRHQAVQPVLPSAPTLS